MDKDHILAEIRRTAEANRGRPLGRGRFAAETGIQEHDWSGRYWARWGDAVAEAGFAPNTLQPRIADDVLLGVLAAEVRRLGRMPTAAELQLRRREDSGIPASRVFDRRLGPKAGWAARVAEFCEGRPDLSDVLELTREDVAAFKRRKFM